jgi:hypothetical protein
MAHPDCHGPLITSGAKALTQGPVSGGPGHEPTKGLLHTLTQPCALWWPLMHPDMHVQKSAIEVEADRLAVVTRRIRDLAHKRRLPLAVAGIRAVRDGLVAEEDWDILQLILKATRGEASYRV